MQNEETMDDVLGASMGNEFWCRECMEEIAEAIDNGEAQLLTAETLETMEREGVVGHCVDCGRGLSDLEYFVE